MPLVTVQLSVPAPAVTSISSSSTRIRYWALDGKAEAEVTTTVVAPDVRLPFRVVHAADGVLRTGALENCSRATVGAYLTLTRLTTPRQTLLRLRSPHLTEPYQTEPYPTVPWPALPRQALPRHALPRHTASRHAPACPAIPYPTGPGPTPPNQGKPHPTMPRHSAPNHPTPDQTTTQSRINPSNDFTANRP